MTEICLTCGQPLPGGTGPVTGSPPSAGRPAVEDEDWEKEDEAFLAFAAHGRPRPVRRGYAIFKGLPVWREDLRGSDRDIRWLTVEEWVGYVERPGPEGDPVRSGGVMGLAIAAWPRVDRDGRVRFPGPDDDGGEELAVDADDFMRFVAERIGAGDAQPPVPGAVFAASLRRWPMPLSPPAPLDAAAMADLFGSLRDITADAQEMARTAFLSSLAPPLDPRLEEALTRPDAGGTDEEPS